MNESCKVEKLAQRMDDICYYMDRMESRGYGDAISAETYKELDSVCDEMRLYSNKWFDFYGLDQYGLYMHKC